LLAIKARLEEIGLGGDRAWHASGARLSVHHKSVVVGIFALRVKDGRWRRSNQVRRQLQAKLSAADARIAVVAAALRDGTIDRINTETS
jgi:hypothetical protein